MPPKLGSGKRPSVRTRAERRNRNFAATGDFSGFRGTKKTAALNQRLDLGGRRQARVGAARAELTVQRQPSYDCSMARQTRKPGALPPAADDPEEGQALQTGGVQSSEGGTTKAPDTSGTEPIVPRRLRRKL